VTIVSGDPLARQAPPHRLGSCGNQVTIVSGVPAHGSFNGAAALGAAETQVIVTGSGAGSSLQWGRSLGSCGNCIPP
jgi:hypothetical protein